MKFEFAAKTDWNFRILLNSKLRNLYVTDDVKMNEWKRELSDIYTHMYT